MNFDLNIKNYKIEELKEMFNLPDGYDTSTLNFNDSKIRENVSLNQTISDGLRKKTLDFLTSAKNILLTSALPDYTMSKMAANNNYNTKDSDSTSLKKSTVLDGIDNSFIIDKLPTAYGQSFGDSYFSGTINPIKKRVVKQFLNIDTRFRDNYYSTISSNFMLTITNKFSNVLSMQISAFEFPTSFYVISKQNGNNFFSIVIDPVGGIEIPRLIITIPNGNYTPASLIGYLINYVSGATGPLSSDLFFVYYKQIYFTLNIDSTNSGSAQMIIGVNHTALAPTDPLITNFNVDFQADIYGNSDTLNPLPLKFGWLLGFRNGIYSGNSSYVSEGIVDLIGSRYLYLMVDDFNNSVLNSFYGAFNSSVINKNILARITLQQGTFNIFAQNNLTSLTTPRTYFGPVDIQKLHIQLMDEYGRVVNLNNMDFSFCLTFESVYDL